MADVLEVVRAAEDCADRNGQHLAQAVARLLGVTPVLKPFENLDHVHQLARFHQPPRKDRKLHKTEGCGQEEGDWEWCYLRPMNVRCVAAGALGVDAPFFMLEIASETEGGDFFTHRMTSNINVLRDHAGTSDAGVLKRVFLLSPGDVNGSDAFQLDALDSVFFLPNNSINMLFKLTDGRTLHFSLGEEQLDDSHYTVQVFKRVPETTQ